MTEPIEETEGARSQSYWRIVFKQYRRRKLAMISLFALIVLALVAILAPFLAGERPIHLHKDGKTYILPNVFQYKDLVDVQFDRWDPGEADYALNPLIIYAPERSDLFARLQAPNRDHLLGTDDRGRDVLSRMIWGTRISMSVGFIAVGIAMVIGVFMGGVSGYYGGRVDTITLRIIETMICFPSLVIILALIAYLGRSIWIIMIVIGIIESPYVARLVRGEFLKLKSADYATAARATGLSNMRIMFRHILPNSMAPVLVYATFGVAGAIITESALSFLGLGVPPPTSSWGEMLSTSKRYIDSAWWLVMFPGAGIFITVTAFNLVGEGLRDAMDPRLRE